MQRAIAVTGRALVGAPARVPTTARRLTTTGLRSLAATIAIVTIGLSGCTPNEATPAPTSPPVSSPVGGASSRSPVPTSSPSPNSTSQPNDEAAAIKSALLDYYKVRSTVSMNPKASIDLLNSVATGELLETELSTQRAWRSKGWRTTAPVQIENLKVVSINVNGHHATATVRYCANSTAVDVVDRHGTSRVAKDRPDRFSQEVRLLKDPSATWLPHQMRTRGDACSTS